MVTTVYACGSEGTGENKVREEDQTGMAIEFVSARGSEAPGYGTEP